MAKKLKVWIDRDQCIADQVCAALCPQVFEMADDGLSSIVAQYRKDPNNLAEGIVPIELKDCVAQAVDSCPVQIIHMEEIEE